MAANVSSIWKKNFAKHSHEIGGCYCGTNRTGLCGYAYLSAIVFVKKLRALCDEYGVLLIADEIATGFGRTGKMFACDHAGITPDIMTISKALTAGYMPMSIMAVTDKIYDAFYADYFEYKAFMHSHTYAGNPIGVVQLRWLLWIFCKTTVS